MCQQLFYLWQLFFCRISYLFPTKYNIMKTTRTTLTSLFLFFICIVECRKYSIFLVGDSTHAFLYLDGFVKEFQCKQPDPAINRNLELVDFPKMKEVGLYTKPGMLCNHPQVHRIGFAMHWGVSFTDEDYFFGWKTHRTTDDTTNSPTNIYNAITEFQQRTRNDSRMMVIFLSNYWDAAKYYTDLESTLPHLNIEDWLKSYRRNYTMIIRHVHNQLQKDVVDAQVILQTAHSCNMTWDVYVPFLNQEILSIGKRHDLPIFRVDMLSVKIMGDHIKDKSLWLRDWIHQNDQMSVALTKEFVLRYLN